MRRHQEKQKAARPPRDADDDIETILTGYGRRARVVQLWRRLDGSRSEWVHLGRLAPDEVRFEFIARRFGGGWYRAKILGAWDRVSRREEYLEQVHFGIAREGWPLTDETRARIAAYLASARTA